MNYKIILFIIFFALFSCKNKENEVNYKKNFINYSNKGFTLIYDDKLYKNKIKNTVKILLKFIFKFIF